jgi:hypothetical protein
MRWIRKSGESGGKQKVRVFLVCLICMLFLSPALCRATIVAFYTDGVIKDGDEYVSVGVYDNAIVNMTGGIVTFQLTSYESSVVNISGGILNAIVCRDESTLSLYGNMEAVGVSVSGSGTMNMYSGTIDSLKISSLKEVYLYGGEINDYLRATSMVNIYGHDFQYNPLAGDYRGGQLTGFWLDDTPLSIDLYYDDTPGGPIIDTYPHIVLIPEPSTILLLGLGVLLQRRLK